MKKLISVILLAAILLTAFPVAVSAGFSPITSGGKLSAKGTALVDKSGNEVVLKGTNLGGWLVYEGWMCSGDLKDGTDLYNTLDARFGKDGARELLKTYEQNWITESDLDRIADMGMNCVRIPFWYRNFQNANGEWNLDESGNIDFSVLEWAVNKCLERGIYVVLDLHGAPGAQSVAHHAGTTGECYLYDFTAEGEQYRAETAIFWKELAARFKDYPNIAAYDLLNEPTCDMNTSDYLSQLWAVYDGLYKAVRSVDSDTVIAFEGVWTLDMLPSPSLFGWENVLYEVHLYNYSNDSIDDAIDNMLKYRDYYNVPVYVGECNFGGCYEYALSRFTSEDVSFTAWTYKGVTEDSGSTWFIYTGTAADADINSDSYETLYEKWSDGALTESMVKNNANAELFVRANAAPPSDGITDTSGTPLGIVYQIITIVMSLYKIVKNIYEKI